MNEGLKRILYCGFLPMKLTLYITWIHLDYLIYILLPIYLLNIFKYLRKLSPKFEINEKYNITKGKKLSFN